MKRVLRIILSVLCGYALMVVLITLVQETWFGGVTWGATPPGALAVAGFFTCLAGAVGAATAGAVARPVSGRIPAIIMACLVAMETTVLVATGKVGGPLWFDIAAALSLMAAILLGGEMYLRLGASSRHRSASA